MSGAKRTGLLAVIGPGLLVAATGVGAGDLATGAFTGNQLGVAVLWAVAVGALVKFVLNEGLARWQLATGETVLEGAMTRFGGAARAVFFVYLVAWSYFVGSALISACGVAGHAMFPVFADPVHGKVAFGIAHSLVGLALVLAGGFRLFEKVMSVTIAVMFVTVLATAAMVKPDLAAVARGLCMPTIPQLSGGGLSWTIALMGGVGGTLTVLCYGYWIREKGRTDSAALRTCRIDLGVGYAATAVFGMAMVVIGSTIQVEGKGAGLVVALADRLGATLGSTGRWVFLIGAWGALFSSLLGVWQAVPYVFADFWRLVRRGKGDRAPVDTRSTPYRVYLFLLAFVPMVGLLGGFRQVQKAYAVFGALFMPLLAASLLVLNGRGAWVGERLRNRPVTSVFLAATVAFFLVAFAFVVRKQFLQ
jgi:Mn2+/Fe2+ NRAMP family transporter